MKKLGTLLLTCALLLTVFCLAAAAVEGEPTFTFDVKGINVGITGEDCAIFTTQEAYEGGNPNWAITLLMKEQADGTFVITQDPLPGGGSVPAVTIGDGVVALVVHSAGDNPEEYSNAEAKLAARAATPGMIIVLDGVDLEDETSSGTAALYAGNGEAPSDEPSSEAPADESSDASEPSEATSSVEAESSVESAPSQATPSQAASSAPTSTTSTASQTSEPSDGLSGGMIALIVVLAVIVVAAVVVIVVVLRKKK